MIVTQRLAPAAFAVVALLVGVAPGLAQTTTTSGLDGKVTDATGAVLPGVTVTISSPALQVPQLLATTDAEGNYRFTGLPAGVYTLGFELSGFQGVKRTEVSIGVGFIATIDLRMTIGNVQETLTISAAAPVVDVRHSDMSSNVTQDLISTLPTSRDPEEIAKLAPGSRISGTPDVGGNRIGSDRGTVNNYGTTVGGQTPMVDGVNTDGTGGYFDAGAFQEVQVRSGGSDAEYATAGLTFVGILKSGGNDFHGEGLYQTETQALQANNIDANLRALGVKGNNPIDRYYDLNGDLGGRILRDRLWFFGSARGQQYRAQLPGFSGGPGPDGVYFTGDDAPGYQTDQLRNYTAKLTGRLTNTQKLEAVYSYNYKFTPDRQGSVFIPHEAAGEYTFPTYIAKAEYTWVPNDRSLFNAFAAQSHWKSLETPYTDNPSTFDIVTSRRTGAVVNSVGNDITPAGSNSNRWQYSASYSHILPNFIHGEHQLKAGVEFTREYYDKYEISRGPGTGGTGNDFNEYFNNGVPFEVLLYNNPFVSLNNVNNQSLYVRDNWRLGDRLTVDAGVRWERYHAFLPEQTKPAGTWVQYFPVATYPYQDLYDWRAPAPRVGMSLALTKDNKTALKASYGRFNFVLRASDSVTIRTFNRNDFAAMLFRWNDANNDRAFQPGEQGSLVSVQGGSSTHFNPDIQQPKVDEVTLQIQREVMNNFSVRAGYVFKRLFNQFELVNVARPYSAYNVPVTSPDPGPDGKVGTADDGGLLTYYDLNPAFGGSTTFNSTYQNMSGYSDHFNNFEFAANKRMSNNWQMLAYVLATKRSVWMSMSSTSSSSGTGGVPLTPNDTNFFPKDETWETTMRLTGSYLMKWGVEGAAVYEYQSGAPLARTVVLTTGLPQLGSVTVRTEPIGAERLPGIKQLNLRLAKNLTFSKSKLTLELEAFNVLNANVPTGQSLTSGPSYGTITGIMLPRVGRVGIRYSF
jgi:outer membrane receptor protein involved in Fe transport